MPQKEVCENEIHFRYQKRSLPVEEENPRKLPRRDRETRSHLREGPPTLKKMSQRVMLRMKMNMTGWVGNFDIN